MPISDEYLLCSPSEVLVRQAHPRDVDEMGRVMTPAFKASASHDFGLSVTMSSQVDPHTATKKYLGLGLPTHSAWGVSVEECGTTGLRAYDDHNDSVEAHAVIDQKPLTTSGLKKAATKLGGYARTRGCLCLASEISTPEPITTLE